MADTFWHDGWMSQAIGRRERHKRLVRAAIGKASKRLFEEQGYTGTTVREIASAARVTERTFYRYYEGKEDLLAEEALAWISRLHAEIRDRPLHEAPFEAVRHAMATVATGAQGSVGPGRLWRFADGPRPFGLVSRTTVRPLLRLEAAIAEAILARPAPGRERPGSLNPADPGVEFRAQLIAGVAVVALRRAAIYHRQQQLRAVANPPSFGKLLEGAFATVADLTGPSPAP
ncbi:MAG TPA: helix-turn-helix domain-containing protein [Candidatus Dormibacteraeota bacterium]|nr:helix-turn-helix domain-containing protein [Candidatus Dormibacteraeota bacterium]